MSSLTEKWDYLVSLREVSSLFVVYFIRLLVPEEKKLSCTSPVDLYAESVFEWGEVQLCAIVTAETDNLWRKLPEHYANWFKLRLKLWCLR